MASTASGSSDEQQAIITHLNKNHSDSLSLYLQVYSKVPYKEAQWPKLEEFRLDGMTISTASSSDSKSRTSFVVPFEPALKGYGDARHKAVEMHKHCLETLGRSAITIQEYRPPTGIHAFLFLSSLLTFITFSSRENFLPGSNFYTYLFQYVPSFAAFGYRIQPLLITTMGGIHLSEAVHMSLFRLRPHNVPFGSRVWFSWVLNDLIEGITTLLRFDALVAEKQAGKA